MSEAGQTRPYHDYDYDWILQGADYKGPAVFTMYCTGV